MTILSFASSDKKLSIFAVADIMEEKGKWSSTASATTVDVQVVVLLGWKIERQLDTLHCTLLPSHTLDSADQFIRELQEACNAVKVNVILVHWL